MENICWQITVADIKQQPNFIHEAHMQKTIVFTNAEKARRNIDGAIA